MKKMLFLVAITAFALAYGAAFADESMPMIESMGPVLHNGITYFDLGPAIDCSGAGEYGVSGSGAGGERSEVIVANGATYFDLGPAESGAKGSCANPPLEEGSIENGITKF